MTARIDSDYEPLGQWELDLLDELGDTLEAADGDLNTVQQEGNVLGAGELWQRLGSDHGPSTPTESVAIGYYRPDENYSFHLTNDGEAFAMSWDR